MAHYEYITRGVCSRKIEFDIEGNGCNGNTQGVSKLIEGMDANEAVRRLKGIDCNGRGTSCPDQLAKAISEVINK